MNANESLSIQHTETLHLIMWGSFLSLPDNVTDLLFDPILYTSAISPNASELKMKLFTLF